MNVEPDISIRAHYERFPATIKGSFVLRGVGRDPHQVRIEHARVTELAGAGSHGIGVEPVTLEVAPRLDLFVPFEFSVTELDAGWYRLECDVLTDGVPGTVQPGERFPVAWPRATVRRGSVTVGTTVETSDGPLTIEQVDLGGDSIKIVFVATTEPTVKLSADDSSLTVLDVEFDEGSGRGRVIAYPLMKTAAVLTLTAKGATDPVDVTLP
ncbi:MAG TPA: hypothetical protein VI341_09065 [Actinomycetota bacterium]